jgi:hypothetical protein
VSILGFYAFGTAVSENVLLAFSEGPRHWVVAMANMMVVVHVAAAYQVRGAGWDLRPYRFFRCLVAKCTCADSHWSLNIQFVRNGIMPCAWHVQFSVMG